MNVTDPDATVSAVAVVTRTKDRPVLLRRAMESVLGQTFGHWVHVVINDGGDAGVVDLLAAEYAAAYHGRLQIIHNPAPVGMQNASNCAIRASKSDYVTIHDDDDSWEPTFLEKCVGHLERQGVDSPVQGVVVYSYWIFEEINALGNVVELLRQDFPADEMIRLVDLAGKNRFPPIAFLYRRRVHETIGYFDETFTVMGDWDFNLRFLCKYDIDVIPEKLAKWHWRHQGAGAAYGNSSTAGVAVHKAMETRLFNHYMRQDLENGRPGLGQLMNVSSQMVKLSQSVDELRGCVEQTSGTAMATLANTGHLNRITRDLTRFWECKDRLLRSVAVIRERRQQATHGSVGGKQRQVRQEIEQFISELRTGDVLSLDVFDTVLLRVLGRPTDLFAFIEPEVRSLPGLSTFPFAQARRTAEVVARQRHVTGGCEDVTFRQIYDVLAEVATIEPDVAERAMAMEVAAERLFCCANPVFRDVVRSAKAKGGRVVFVSDMYLPTDTVRDLLERNGFDSPEVYVSCTASKTKHSGALFEDVLVKLECSAERVFHVGDHPESDGRRPRTMGIHSLHIERKDYGAIPWVDQHTALCGTGSTDVLSSVFTGLARRRTASFVNEDIWNRLGYEVVGPMAYAFARWIAQRADAQGIRRLFFLARDGYLLEKVFRSCSARWGLGLESTYMYSSRRLINMARIERLDETAFHFLLTSEPFLRVRDFLQRIGLTPESVSPDVIHRAGLSGLDEVLTTQDCCFRTAELRDAMKRLLISQEAPILEIAAKERETLFAYFGDIGFTHGGVSIVDLGWQASAVFSLQDLLRRQEPDCQLTGYYFGTWEAASSAVNAGCQLESFLVHLGQPQHRAGLLAECVGLLELLFSAPHPTVTGLAFTSGQWSPVCGDWETTSTQREWLETVSRSAMAFVADMLKVESKLSSHEPPFGYLESVLERLLRHPTRIEAETLGGLPHRDSFGGHAPWRYLAKVPTTVQTVLKPSSLREAYARAYWKKGFLAQLGPMERAMTGEQ